MIFFSFIKSLNKSYHENYLLAVGDQECGGSNDQNPDNSDQPSDRGQAYCGHTHPVGPGSRQRLPKPQHQSHETGRRGGRPHSYTGITEKYFVV